MAFIDSVVMVEPSQVADGEQVQIRYKTVGGGCSQEGELMGEVVSDPYQHRATPEGVLDVSVDGKGIYVRVTEDGRLMGLDTATKRRDVWMGKDVEVTLS